MKRGFLNDGRYKRAIDEVYTPAAPSVSKRPHEGKRVSSGGAPDDCGGAGGRDKIDLDVKGEQSGSPEGNGIDHAQTEDETPAEAKDPKGKGKAKVVDVDHPYDARYAGRVGTMPTRPRLLRRPGWGRDPEEDFFHRVPESHGGPHVKRAVFRLWPRDPNGKPLEPLTEKTRWKTSMDGYAWFETLYDVFWVHRLPKVLNFESLVTGSMMCAMMKELGELNAAAPEIEWAESEGQPRVEAVANTGELIRRMDKLRLAGGYNPSVHEGEESREEDNEHVTANANDALHAYYIPPFRASHYPEPSPLTPFGNTFPVLLQERIPLYLLPKTLYVHDPFGLLTVCKREFCNTSWTSRPDVVRTYDLNLSFSVYSQIEEERRKAEELEEFKARTLIVLRYQRTEKQIKNYEPVIEVPLPPYIRRPTSVKESHLYLSPIAKVGEGHHSIVYKGEWELPRDMFVRPEICPACFVESAEKEVQRMKDTGTWEKMLRAVSWGPHGYTGHPPSQVDLDAVCHPHEPESDVEIIERTIICVIPPGMAPSQVVELIDASDVWDTFKDMKGANSLLLPFIPDTEMESKAPIIRVDPPFSYKSQGDCTHKPPGPEGPVPRTARFTVVAKLSIKYDPHLEREARNYQEFPEHLFNHYNGYTINNQLKSIVPVNAVVSQFYGYYAPKRGEQKRDPGEPSYLSPILLLEHCGTPVEPQELSLEDQEECASLILRFQAAGWLHESIAPRNFLVQYGKPTEFPTTRTVNPEPSFRLIDFGRSRKYTTAEEKCNEEKVTIKMFDKLSWRMAITLDIR